MGDLNSDWEFNVTNAQQLNFLGVIIVLWLYFLRVLAFTDLNLKNLQRK